MRCCAVCNGQVFRVQSWVARELNPRQPKKLVEDIFCNPLDFVYRIILVSYLVYAYDTRWCFVIDVCLLMHVVCWIGWVLNVETWWIHDGMLCASLLVWLWTGMNHGRFAYQTWLLYWLRYYGAARPVNIWLTSRGLMDPLNGWQFVQCTRWGSRSRYHIGKRR